MDFGSAIQAVKNGNSVYREKWEAEEPARHIKLGGIDSVTEVKDDGSSHTYCASPDDMLAEDWRYYNGPGGAVTQGHEEAPPGGFAVDGENEHREVSPTVEANPGPGDEPPAG